MVLHPLIDAMVAIHQRKRIDPQAVSEIILRVHPLAVSITGVMEPSTGLQSKFSYRHSAAAALVDGNAGIPQYTDAKANDPLLVALRRKVQVIGDDTLRKDEARATVVAGDLREDVHIEHASGTVDNPMSDAAIEAKFLANATSVIGAARARQVAELVWSLEKVADARAARATRVSVPRLKGGQPLLAPLKRQD